MKKVLSCAPLLYCLVCLFVPAIQFTAQMTGYAFIRGLFLAGIPGFVCISALGMRWPITIDLCRV